MSLLVIGTSGQGGDRRAQVVEEGRDTAQLAAWRKLANASGASAATAVGNAPIRSRTTVQVSGLFLPGAVLEVEVTAAAPAAS